MKSIDNLHWHQKLGEIAAIDLVSFTSLPPAREANPTGQGAGHAHTFIPKKLDRSKKQYAHGGVHANFNTSSVRSIKHK